MHLHQSWSALSTNDLPVSSFFRFWQEVNVLKVCFTVVQQRSQDVCVFCQDSNWWTMVLCMLQCHRNSHYVSITVGLVNLDVIAMQLLHQDIKEDLFVINICKKWLLWSDVLLPGQQLVNYGAMHAASKPQKQSLCEHCCRLGELWCDCCANAASRHESLSKTFLLPILARNSSCGPMFLLFSVTSLWGPTYVTFDAQRACSWSLMHASAG